MARKFLIPTLVFMGISVLGQACAPAPQSEISQLNLANLSTLLPGEYVGQTDDGEVYHSIVKMDVPQFGGEVFYHHISVESPRGAVFQSKVYAFEEEGRRMRATVLLGPAGPFIDDKTMAENLNALPEARLLRFPDACRPEWSLTEGGYRAVVYRDRCRYESPAFGGVVSPEMEYVLSACGLKIKEGIYRENGSPLFPPSNTNNRRAGAEIGDCES